MLGQVIPAGIEEWRSDRDPRAAVRELHHRVSNHLQILASLIGLQARNHAHPEVRDALLDTRRRVLAVARVNSEIQHSDDTASMQLSPFLGRLRNDLLLCFAADLAFPFVLEFDIDDMEAPVETALTLSLIVNELVTNAVKHAVLPHGGKVQVQLRRRPGGEWRLAVRDEGRGLGQEALEGEAHGLAMVRALAAKLGGVVTIAPTTVGATVCVAFR
ncbi:MAG: sensor histidine kinase [Alphaproteobacteria bacterium]|nr:sensor histidine kinase [Alphaproteobacteria bacterium]